MKMSEEEFREYTEKRKRAHESSIDFLGAEAERQKRVAAKGLDANRRESGIQNSAVRRIRQDLMAAGYDWRLLCGNDGGSEIAGERLRLVRLGYVMGWPDLELAIPAGEYHGLYIEVKTPSGKISEEQMGIHAMLRDQGYAVAVTYGEEQTVAAVRDYLKI